MICQFCNKKEATVHYTEVINNKVSKIHLCEDCAKQKGMDIELPFSFGDIIKAISKGIEGLEHFDAKQFHGDVVCPECGLEIQELIKQGKMGCPHCYKAFEEVLSDIIKNVQKAPSHKGKVPKSLPPSINYKRRIKELEKKLQEAINEERYEDCVHLRDEINTLNDALNNESGDN